MALSDSIGYSFNPSRKKQQQQSGVLPAQAQKAIQMIRLHLPNVLGGKPIAPGDLLRGRGLGAGMPCSSVIDSILNASGGSMPGSVGGAGGPSMPGVPPLSGSTVGSDVASSPISSMPFSGGGEAGGLSQLLSNAMSAPSSAMTPNITAGLVAGEPAPGSMFPSGGTSGPAPSSDTSGTSQPLPNYTPDTPNWSTDSGATGALAPNAMTSDFSRSPDLIRRTIGGDGGDWLTQLMQMLQG